VCVGARARAWERKGERSATGSAGTQTSECVRAQKGERARGTEGDLEKFKVATSGEL